MREGDASKLTTSNKRLETTRLAAVRLAYVSQFVRCISRTASTSRYNLYPTATCIWTDNRYKAVSMHRTSLFGGLPSVNGFKSSLASSHVDTLPLHLAISKSRLNPLNKAQPRHHQYRSTCLTMYLYIFLITIMGFKPSRLRLNRTA